jgi:phosphatidylglycerophosphatase A
MREFFLTGFYSGLLPKAPGTWGSVVGGIIGVAFLYFLPPSTLVLFTILITIISVKEINKYEEETGIHDASKIVIDEIAGMFLALSISGISIASVILSFIFFRVFDIWKPSIIGRIDEKVKGGWGVMGDDLVAGISAGLMSALCILIYNDYLSQFIG